MLTYTTQQTIKANKTFYSRFSYPNYPLLAKPRWQETYLSSPYFAQQLLQHSLKYTSYKPQPIKKILIAGCGEMQPVVYKKWCQKGTEVDCVDLSNKNLSRAKFRVGLSRAKFNFINQSIEEFAHLAIDRQVKYDHIDIYGVLHHLANPRATLSQLSKLLSDHGVIRLMVYNSYARKWIISIQKFFSSLDLSPYIKNDLIIAKRILRALLQDSDILKQKFQGIGLSIFENDSRFVDTFFHVREANIDLRQWYEMFGFSHLAPFALFDRYGELDDLKNPLWEMPTLEQLQEKVCAGKYENNFEFYVCKSEPKFELSNVGKNHNIRSVISSSPKLWDSFDECDALSKIQKMQIWYSILDGLKFGYVRQIDCSKFDRMAVSRLARIGGMLPFNIKGDFDQFSLAIGEDIETRQVCGDDKKVTTELPSIIKEFFKNKYVDDPRKRALVDGRLRRVLSDLGLSDTSFFKNVL